jgi:2-dehydropantoate 2-reductase
MKILIMGAGALGSLFGGFLSKNNDVILIGRKPHVEEVKRNGLSIDGITKINLKLNAEHQIQNIDFFPDLVILMVKSYDTKKAINQIKPLINENTFILSLQNGIDNIEKITKVVDSDRILAGITTHGALFDQPGLIKHTGEGKTIIGSISEENFEFLNNLIDSFNNSGIKTSLSKDINEEIWKKAIINSSINPLTLIFGCKNGNLLDNPIAEKIVEKICYESTEIAISHGINTSFEEMIDKTKDVIIRTKDNYSSMFQSFKKGKKTEVDSINGILVNIGKKNKCQTLLNDTILRVIKSITE